MKQMVMGVILVCAVAVKAEIVVSYDYSATDGKNPTQQGWMLDTFNPGVQNGSYDAGTGWRVTDALDLGCTRYDRGFTVDQANMLNQGWVAHWTFSLDSDLWSSTGAMVHKGYYLPQTYPTLQNDGGLSIAISGDEKTIHYRLLATADTSGNLAISDGQALHVLTSNGKGFDLMTSVRIVYDGTDAKMYYDDQTFDLSQTNPFYGVNRVRFGSQKVNQRGGVVYNTVTLSTIPEPATIVILGMGALLSRKFKRA